VEAGDNAALTCAYGAFWSGRWDLNPRSPAPKARSGAAVSCEDKERRRSRPPWCVRDCPLETGQDRCEWHASGMAGEDDPGIRGAVGATVIVGRPLLGDHGIVAKSPRGSRQVGLGPQPLQAPFSPHSRRSPVVRLSRRFAVSLSRSVPRLSWLFIDGLVRKSVSIRPMTLGGSPPGGADLH
jgi:hypothetical protein